MIILLRKVIFISKYRACKIYVDSIKFDSQMEADFYLELKKLKREGKIVDFELQPVFNLIPKFKKDGVSYRKMDYIADFRVFIKDGEIVKEIIYDVKGFSRDSTFLVKYKLFNYFYKDTPLVLITFYKGQWMTVEEKQKIQKQRKKQKNKGRI